MATSFNGGRTRREAPTMSKQLVNFIISGCESSALFFVIYKAGCEPTPYPDNEADLQDLKLTGPEHFILEKNLEPLDSDDVKHFIMITLLIFQIVRCFLLQLSMENNSDNCEDGYSS